VKKETNPTGAPANILVSEHQAVRTASSVYTQHKPQTTFIATPHYHTAVQQNANKAKHTRLQRGDLIGVNKFRKEGGKEADTSQLSTPTLAVSHLLQQRCHNYRIILLS
jgi:hypothetical protein